MPSVSISLDSDVLASLDRERRWVVRSNAINLALKYVLQTPGTLRQLCGVDKLPPEYQVE